MSSKSRGSGGTVLKHSSRSRQVERRHGWSKQRVGLLFFVEDRHEARERSDYPHKCGKQWNQELCDPEHLDLETSHLLRVDELPQMASTLWCERRYVVAPLRFDSAPHFRVICREHLDIKSGGLFAEPARQMPLDTPTNVLAFVAYLLVDRLTGSQVRAFGFLRRQVKRLQLRLLCSFRFPVTTPEAQKVTVKHIDTDSITASWRRTASRS